jgi:predicted transposase/invertase (TIGR01784 family)
MAEPQVSRAFFEHHLPINIKAAINLETLHLHKESYVDEQLKLLVTDMLFSADFGATPGYLYLLVEHQSMADRLMPLRILKYMTAIMEQHLKKSNSGQLPVVYPLLFYNGKEEYRYSTDLFELFAEHADLMREVWSKPFQLIEINKIPDETLRQKAWLGVMELCMKHVFKRDILSYLEVLLDPIKQVEQAGGINYIQTALTYLLNTNETTDKKALFEAVCDNLSEESGEKIMTIADQLRAEGKAEEKRAIALRLLKVNIPIEAIIRVTELSPHEIERLATEDLLH